MRTEELDYELPRELVAVRPAEPRESARLMVVRGERVEHRVVGDLPEVLGRGDRLVMNATRVLPARFEGVFDETGGSVEGLWLRDEPGAGALRWAVLLRAKRPREGRVVRLERGGVRTGVELRLVERAEAEGPGAWVVEVEGRGGDGGLEGETTPRVLERAGLTPLPPYILAARRDRAIESDDASDRAWYQSVVAASGAGGGVGGAFGDGGWGSVAAPTASLHVTEGMLARLSARGVDVERVTLHVGSGTFRGIETERVDEHVMHAEWCSLWPSGRERVLGPCGGRVVAVGTTAARTLESFAGVVAGGAGWMSTRLMITPGYRWRAVGGLLTNFHLPRSTLMALVSAMLPGGVEQLRGLYAEAVRERYRFYSFGDAMLVLPEG